jgi:hypothetical protein
MERDASDDAPQRRELNELQRAELRSRIRDLLASRSLAQKVRGKLAARIGDCGNDSAIDGAFVDLPDSIQRFFRGSDGGMASFTSGPIEQRESQTCSKP